MSLGHGAKIVRSGLVLHLDAANRKSYAGTGTSWKDLSGNSNDGTLVNGVGYSSDNNGAMVFDTTNDYITVPNTSSINQVNTVTLEAYVKYTLGTNRVLIEKSSNNTHYQFQIFSSSQGTAGIAGEIVFMLQPNASNWVVTGVSSNDNNWHHVVGTYDRNTTTAKIYLDGVLKNTNSSITFGPTSNIQPLMIGSRSGASGFGGNISNIKIYNRAISAAEIRQNFEATRSRYGI